MSGSWWVVLLACCASMWLTDAARAAEPAVDSVRVTIKVAVPAAISDTATVYLATSRADLGGEWNSAGVPLTRDADGAWGVELTLPRGGTLQYKFTLGSWETVEKTSDGGEVANRTLPLNADGQYKLSVARFASGPAAQARRATLSGDIRTHKQFASTHLNNKRDIRVYLPPDYGKQTRIRYPVLYMHDGQNVFDETTSFAGEWRADETAERLIRAGEIRPIIIVAIDNAGMHRMAEYTPTVDARLNIGGKSDRYGKFLVEELKPFIDRTYRTMPGRESTAVAGSSLGGLVSLHLAMTHPDEIGLCAAISPSLWWDRKHMLSVIAQSPEWTKRCRIWIDMGTAEDSEDQTGKNVENTRELATTLENAGLLPGHDFIYERVDGGAHNEKDWAARFDRVLRFLFPREP